MKFNKGFSLTEVLIVLAILTIFAAMSAPIFTKKFLKPTSKPPHGQYECYRKTYDGVPYYRLSVESTPGTETAAPGGVSCSFTPPPRAAFFMVALVGGGGSGAKGASGGYGGGGAGTLVTMFYPSLDSPITLYPGKGAAVSGLGSADGNQGETSYIGANALTAAGALGGRISSAVPSTPPYTSATGQTATFDAYRQMGNYSYGVSGSGNGGNAAANGNPGAVLIIW